MDEETGFGCSAEFAELCALSTAGWLTFAEEERLQAHIAACSHCAVLLNQYRVLATAGMAEIGAMRADRPGGGLPHAEWMKARLLSALPPDRAHAWGGAAAGRYGRPQSGWMPAGHLRLAAAAACLVLFAAAGGYGVAYRTAHPPRAAETRAPLVDAMLARQLAEARSQLASSREESLAAARAAETLEERIGAAGTELNGLRERKAALDIRIEDLESDARQQRAAAANLAAERDALAARLRDSEVQQRVFLARLTTERDALAQKVRDSERVLEAVRQELKFAQEERRQYLLRAAAFEARVDELSGQLRERERPARRDGPQVATDRDIRDLMGARQLYIADVFDVDPQGRTRKPFGRVFYTKGKSLILYAFDLDQHPGYRNAEAFQAWGRPSTGRSTPVSLGIFYLESETNRRWALKFEDLKVLEEIGSLFVTVEPKGGSKRPTNKPFLLAYLHTATANHP